MKTLPTAIKTHFLQLNYQKRRNLLTTFQQWVKEQQPVWEYNRLGLSTIGITLQVTFAGAMMAVLGLAGASPWVYSVGIFFSFMANSISFGQCPMRWVLGAVTVSILLDILLITYYAIQLLNR
jgi:hypothetical protein